MSAYVATLDTILSLEVEIEEQIVDGIIDVAGLLPRGEMGESIDFIINAGVQDRRESGKEISAA